MLSSASLFFGAIFTEACFGAIIPTSLLVEVGNDTSYEVRVGLSKGGHEFQQVFLSRGRQGVGNDTLA